MPDANDLPVCDKYSKGKAAMKKQLNIVISYLFIFICLAYAEFHASYYVTITANNYIQDSQSTTSYSFENHIIHENISIHTRLLQLPRPAGLSHVISMVSSVLSQNITTKRGKEIFHLCQVGKKRKSILEEIYWNKRLTSSGITKCCQLFEENINTHSSCGKFKTIYADDLAILIRRIFVQPVMIVVDEDSCSHQFASMIKNSLYVNAANYQEPFFHFVNDSAQLLTDISQMLYKATVQSVKTIILLCPDSLIDLIFRLARSSSISYSNVLWVGIEYSSTINNTLAPSLLLSISLQSDTDTAVTVLNDNASKILATKAVASMAVKEKAITKLVGIKLVKQSLEALPKPSCSIRYVNIPVVLVSLRQSQYTWMPLYTVGYDNAITQLVEDKKVSWLSRLKNHKAKIIVTTILELPFVSVARQYFNQNTRTCDQGIKCRIPKQSNTGTAWEASCCVGSIMDLLKKLQEDLWLSIDLHVTEDYFYGTVINGKWNGMIGELVNGKADIAFAALTATTKRSAVVDFGESFSQVTLGILVTSKYVDGMKFVNFNFAANVTGNLLLTLFGIFACGLLALYAAENFVSNNKSQKKKYTFREGFSYLSGITFQRDLGGKNPQQYATRIMFIVFAFGMVIIMTTYTATLTAVQVKQDNNVVLKGMNDPKLTNPTDSFRFATLKSSSVQDYFRFSDNAVYRRMNVFMEKYNVATCKIGAQKVINGELKAFIAEHSFLQYQVSQQKDCQLRAIKTTNGQSSWNVAYQKNSPWKSIISKKILEYKEKGLFDDIMTKWIQTRCLSQKDISPTSQKYRIAHFSGLIILLACMLLFSIIILFVERWIFKKIKNSSDYTLDMK